MVGASIPWQLLPVKRTDQSINQPDDQSIDQPAGQPTNEGGILIDQPAD